MEDRKNLAKQARKKRGEQYNKVERKTVKFINMTDHDVTDSLTKLTIPFDNKTYKKNEWARAIISTKLIYFANNIPIVSSEITGISNLPEQKEDTIYIVSSLCISAMAYLGIDDRSDIVSPGPVERKDGEIIGCKGFRTVEDLNLGEHKHGNKSN